ncbi:MAG: DNA-binding protein [Caulobacter sp. 12-67-6]|nr:MAG: DNA-binding protein [Caulobacter sp. 12-67-6]OYX72990.1 MAG: DNA-binding protein [Caulobacter sp. 32-67-35]OYX91431.1 MAG: DNA-binding protein [Caulobacter sp. 35-67-4]
MAEPVNTPWPCEVPLARVDRGDVSLKLEPDADQRKAIAKQLGLVRLEEFSAEVYLSSWMDGAEVAGRLRARVIQLCSVSADDFEDSIEARFTVHVIPANSEHAPAEEGGELGLDPEADDPPDVLEGDVIDVSGYVLEHLALELDPFPRKPGAVFENPLPTAEISPFAALKALKPKGDSD